MEKLGVEIRIDMRKIDMTKVYKGAKGDYLTMTAFISPNEIGRFDDHGMVTMKTEKDSEERGVPLGNVKVFWTDDNSHAKPDKNGGKNHATQNKPSSNFDEFEEDKIPF